MLRSIVLVGSMGAGKSTVAPLLARRLNLPSLDTDTLVEARAGLTIPEIFSELGEARFRLLESEALNRALDEGPAIIATGGGAALDSRAWESIFAAGALSLYLDAPVPVLADRLRAQVRPLLIGISSEEELFGRLSTMAAEREPWYRRADLHVDAGQEPAEVARIAAEAVFDGLNRSVPLRLKEASHAFWLEEGVEDLGERLARRISPSGAGARCALVSDENVARLYWEPVEESLRRSGFEVVRASFSPGEASKTLETAGRIIDSLLDAGHQRGSPVIALGGGVTGDLAGFVAAVLHRGCPLVQVPTSLLAMVDAAIGGKTGVDHRFGKNLIGAFHQPVLVHAPLRALGSLEPRQYLSGLGEVVKMGLLDPGWKLLELIEKESSALAAGDLAVLRPVIVRCVRMKAEVIERDPTERSGQRRILNLGHTLGHALEAETAYRTYLHGEAVGLGLLAAARVGASLGLLPAKIEGRVKSLLRALGLPWDASPLMTAGIVKRAMRDKKTEGDSVHFVVPVAGGGAQLVPLTASELESILKSSRGGA